MAYIKTLKDNELVNGTNNDDVYPVSTTQALFSQYVDSSDHQIHVRMKGNKPEKLEDRLQDHERDAQELHRKTEKLVVYLNNNKAGQTLEITGTDNVISLTGYANIETFGDELSDAVSPDDMTTKQLSVNSVGVEGEADGNNWVGTYTLPNAVGTYTAKFEVVYNGISRSATSSTNVNLRKFFGFADTAPTDTASIEALSTTNLSNSVACTFTINAISDGFKHIYFAVPQPMVIHSIIQPQVGPDTPFVFHSKGTVGREINGVTYTYNLYESGTTDSSADGLEDTSYSKVLTIKS